MYYPAARGGSIPSEAGPGRLLQGAWSGWGMEPGAQYVRTHPSGPVGAPGPSLVLLEQIAASWPIRARFDLILLKVSQNA